jgi:hypothetical protein
MGRSTKSGSAETFGKNDEQLKEFAQGEDVGHGLNHDCPLCRKNRQALKLANLKASDIRGLEGGKPPTDPLIEDIPTPQNALAESAASQPTVSSDPNDKPISGDGSGVALPPISAEQRIAPSATPATHFTPEDIAFTDEQDRQATSYADRHRRLVSLSIALDDALRAALPIRGMDPYLVESYELDFGEAIIEAGGRYQLMAGFIPDDRDWHCEVGFGAERAHVQHPDRTTAIKLATLLAINPKGGAQINSMLMQLLSESRPQATVRHWTGMGVQS